MDDRPPVRTLGDTFEEDAAAYERYRPTYAPIIAETVTAFCKLEPGTRILELGPGTGQATGMFQLLSPRQTCVDPGENLLARCAARFPDYEHVNCRFEDYEGEDSSFDLIYAATSFHWLLRGYRFRKSARLLRPGGHLAVITDRHEKDMAGFFDDLDVIYEELAPDMVSPFDPGPSEPETNPMTLVHSSTSDRVVTYTTDDYIGLLHTFSGHIALGRKRLDDLCERIAVLMEKRYNGRISKTLTTYLDIYQNDP